jgi:hypothetical protein
MEDDPMLNNRPRIKVVVLGVAMLLLVAMFAPTAAASPPARPVVSYATRSDATGPLRDLPQIPPMPAVLGTIFQRPRKLLPNRTGGGAAAPDPVVQESVGSAAAASVGSNFEGVNNVNGVLPPDTNGDVGPNHYVQMVNLAFAIYDKSGTKLYGPVNGNTLWQGFGGPCETTNDGDPIVQYDHLADRWMMSQFALPRYPRGPFYQCIAVSQTPSPLGAWNRYEFQISSSKLNDYPKFGVWPDGYYMSINQFQCNIFGCSWAGQGVIAFERDQMLAGGSARMVYFDLYNTDANLGGMLPADLDGPAPVAGTPNPFVQMDDDAWGYSPDQLQIWNFHVDWNNPSGSTFQHNVDLGVAAFDSNLCGYARNCIPQPGGTKLDAISDRPMYRLQYRNFGSYQTLVTNQTVDVGGDHAGVRWYELQNSGGGWSIAQQGTYAPDNAHRWMGSVAMNGAGDMALGYSVSSTSISPSIRFTGRLASDPLGDMNVAEGTIINGSGYQTHSSGRWGDYSMMAVDPTDDCTFWYTTEYYNGVSSAGWQTRVGSFTLGSCGTVDNPPSVTITNPAGGATVSGTVTVTANASDDNGVTSVTYNVDGGLEQPMSLSTGSANNGTWTATWNSASTADGTHTITVTATDTASHPGSDSVGVTVDNVDEPPLVSTHDPVNGSTVSGVVTIQVGASDDRDATGTLTVEVSIDGGTWQSASYNGGSGYYESAWDTTGLADQTNHTIDSRATDSGNSTTNASQVTVTVDNAPPPAGVTVVGITPNSVLAGRSVNVTISGSGFAAGASVTLENGSGPALAVSNVAFVDANKITATITAKSGGPPGSRVWDVRVTNTDGSTGVLAGGFTVTK